jgi:aspartate/methionine/tyrosine aminotransferase
MLIINFPSNPTAQCVELPFFEKIVALAQEYGIYVVHDLAYADICFDGWKAPSIMQVPGARDVAVEFFTMSKSYNMAGWRIGFMVGNKDSSTRWRASRATTTTARSRRCRSPPSRRWKGRRSASRRSRTSTRAGATCW